MKSNISENLLVGAEHLVSKQKNYQDYLIGLSALLVAVALSVLLVKIDFGKDSPVFFTLWLVVAVALGTAIFKISRAQSIYTMKDTKEPLNQYVLYFDGLSPEDLITILQSSNYDRLKKYFRNEEKGLKVELATSADNLFARCLVYKFIPYSYEVVSEVITLSSVSAFKTTFGIK
ncbi:MAG: hypothetical protein EOM76_10005 [Sphingobacteriia bacterium]|jgi:hypothetical protein|nr:hypothetical protein [Paludibacteraceae bacterium]NCA80497.1 hypothetical protein [Sphingobacteriia bacterium]